MPIFPHSKTDKIRRELIVGRMFGGRVPPIAWIVFGLCLISTFAI